MVSPVSLQLWITLMLLCVATPTQASAWFFTFEIQGAQQWEKFEVPYTERILLLSVNGKPITLTATGASQGSSGRGPGAVVSPVSIAVPEEGQWSFEKAFFEELPTAGDATDPSRRVIRLMPLQTGNSRIVFRGRVGNSPQEYFFDARVLAADCLPPAYVDVKSPSPAAVPASLDSSAPRFAFEAEGAPLLLPVVRRDTSTPKRYRVHLDVDQVFTLKSRLLTATLAQYDEAKAQDGHWARWSYDHAYFEAMDTTAGLHEYLATSIRLKAIRPGHSEVRLDGDFEDVKERKTLDVQVLDARCRN